MARSFKDNSERTWQVEITIATVKRVRTLLDVDLLEVTSAGDGECGLLRRLMNDPVLLVDVVYAVCKPQADAAGVSDESFGQAMAGDAIDLATSALLEALVDFCPSRGQRDNLGQALQMSRRVIDRGHDLVGQRIRSAEISAGMERAMANAVDEAFAELMPPSESGGTSGESPACSESTPTPSPSGSCC